MDITPLFAPGFHEVQFNALTDVFVLPFSNKERRQYLTDRLCNFIEKFNEFKISYELWIDGSFSTTKENPKDIDILIVCQSVEINILPSEKQQELQLILDQPEAKIRYNLDLYFMLDGDINSATQRSYWRGWFGFSREETPKGIPRIIYGIN